MKEEFYWRKFAFSYRFAEKVCFVRNLHSSVCQQIEKDYPEKHARILDVGCGSGTNSIYLARQGYQEIIGLDPGESILAIAQSRVRLLSLTNCTFSIGDITKTTPYKTGSFEIILSTHVFQKIDEYDKGLQEIYRLLHPEGKFYFTIPSSTEPFSTWLHRYIESHGIMKALWDIRWLLAWNLPYVLLTKKEERKNENRWDILTMEEKVTQHGFSTCFIRSLPYFHVGCTFGVFTKSL